MQRIVGTGTRQLRYQVRRFGHVEHKGDANCRLKEQDTGRRDGTVPKRTRRVWPVPRVCTV